MIFFFNKRALISLPVFVLLILVSFLILAFSYYVYDYYEEEALSLNTQKEILNELYNFRTQILDMMILENSSKKYVSYYEDDLLIKVEDNFIIGEKEINGKLINVNISSLGIPFQENFTYFVSQTAIFSFSNDKLFLNFYQDFNNSVFNICLLDNVFLNNGQNYRFYKYDKPYNNLDGCFGISQIRTCENGILSASSEYKYSNCDDDLAPSGDFGEWILVFGNPHYDGVDDFYVMKYEAKAYDSSSSEFILDGGFSLSDNWADLDIIKANSSPYGRPWVRNTWFKSKDACSDLGDGYGLISENEWLTIARNIDQVNLNWNSSQVGIGSLYVGHSDNSPFESLNASLDDGDGYYRTSNLANSIQRRTLYLNTGEVIWDFAGNVWEYIDETMSKLDRYHGGDSGYMSYHSNDSSTSGLIATNVPFDKLPSLNWNANQGMGRYYDGLNLGGGYNNINEYPDFCGPDYCSDEVIFMRGGNVLRGLDSGIYAIDLGAGRSYTGNYHGFRCTYNNPKPKINLEVNTSFSFVGDSVLITWSSLDADSCVASGNWSGVKPISGSESILLRNSYTYEFELTCENSYGINTRGVSVKSSPDCSVLHGDWVLVPGNEDLGTNDFCVMKYEARAYDLINKEIIYDGCGNLSNLSSCYFTGSLKWANLDNIIPFSSELNNPWRRIDFNDAKNSCLNLGEGYHLITNREWMTIARDIESFSNNWNSSIVGTGVISRGFSNIISNWENFHPAYNSSSECEYAYNVSNQVFCSNSGPFEYKRTLVLSNSEIIWDLSGNVVEWVDLSENNSILPGNVCGVTGSWRSFVAGDGNPVCSWQSPYAKYNAFDKKFEIGPLGEYNNNNFMGKIYSNSSVTNSQIIRGSSFSGGEYSGIYNFNQADSDRGGARLGFRCTYVPDLPDEDTFVSFWDTSLISTDSSNSTQIKLPLYHHFDGSIYNFTVYWGDGSSDNISEWNQAEVTHNYENPGRYRIKISGQLSGFRFANSGDKLKILDISQWGSLNLGNLGGYFQNASNLKISASDMINLSGTTNLESMFMYASSFNTDISNWDVSNVTNMGSMFEGASSFNQDLGLWDVSKVTNMLGLFAYTNLSVVDLSSWNTSNVEDMGWMFDGLSSFNSDLSSWNTSKVIILSAMFRGANSFTSDLSNWDVSKVTSMTNLFNGANSFTSDLSNWDVSKVSAMAFMFNGAYNFTSDLSSWNVSIVTNMRSMFRNANSFNSNLSSWNVSSARYMHSMFRDAISFNSDLSSWNVSNVEEMYNMFNGASIFNSDLSSWDVSKVTVCSDFNLSTPNWTLDKPNFTLCSP